MTKKRFLKTVLSEYGKDRFKSGERKYWISQYEMWMKGDRGPNIHDLTALILQGEKDREGF